MTEREKSAERLMRDSEANRQRDLGRNLVGVCMRCDAQRNEFHTPECEVLALGVKDPEMLYYMKIKDGELNS